MTAQCEFHTETQARSGWFSRLRTLTTPLLFQRRRCIDQHPTYGLFSYAPTVVHPKMRGLRVSQPDFNFTRWAARIPSPFLSRRQHPTSDISFFERPRSLALAITGDSIPRDRTGKLSPLFCRKQWQEQFMTRRGSGGGHGELELQRRPRQGTASAGAFAEGVRLIDMPCLRGATKAGGAPARWGAATNTRRRLAGQRRSRPARGSSMYRAAVLLAFLGDTAAFQVCDVRVARRLVCMGLDGPWL